MEKISSFLCFIVLLFFIISCDNSKDCCDNGINPYVITIANISKSDKEISMKLYKKTENKSVESINWGISSYTQSISSKDNTPITLKVKESEEFALDFSPYENNIEGIGKENVFYYEVYENNKLIINKKIIIKSSYIDLKEKNPWKLKTDLLKVENENYLKEINKKGYPFIKLEF